MKALLQELQIEGMTNDELISACFEPMLLT